MFCNSTLLAARRRQYRLMFCPVPFSLVGWLVYAVKVAGTLYLRSCGYWRVIGLRRVAAVLILSDSN